MIPMYETGDKVVVLHLQEKTVEEEVYEIKNVIEIAPYIFVYSLEGQPDTLYPEKILRLHNPKYTTFEEYAECDYFVEQNFIRKTSAEQKPVFKATPKKLEKTNKTDDILDAYNLLKYLAETLNDPEYYAKSKILMEQLKSGKKDMDLSSYFPNMGEKE